MHCFSCLLKKKQVPRTESIPTAVTGEFCSLEAGANVGHAAASQRLSRDPARTDLGEARHGLSGAQHAMLAMWWM